MIRWERLRSILSPNPLADGLSDMLFYLEMWPEVPPDFHWPSSFPSLINQEVGKLQQIVIFLSHFWLATWNTVVRYLHFPLWASEAMFRGKWLRRKYNLLPMKMDLLRPKCSFICVILSFAHRLSSSVSHSWTIVIGDQLKHTVTLKP